MLQLSTNRCSCIAVLWVSIVMYAAITLYVASQRVIPKVRVYFFIDSVRKLFWYFLVFLKICTIKKYFKQHRRFLRSLYFWTKYFALSVKYFQNSNILTYWHTDRHDVPIFNSFYSLRAMNAWNVATQCTNYTHGNGAKLWHYGRQTQRRQKTVLT
jgi:hypothetical protein